MERRNFLGLAAATAATAAVAGCDVISPLKPDLYNLVASDPDLSTLYRAIQAAGLVSAFKGPGPYTLFAPSNAAFAALPEGMLEDLLKPENKARLAAILAYHVVPGRGLTRVLAGKQLDVVTVQGQKLHIDARGGKMTVNDAVVIKADMVASNGLIHVINKVLMPKI